MNDAAENSANRGISTCEIARFEALLSLITTDTQVIWNRYYSMLTVNVILATVICALATKKFTGPVCGAIVVLSILGFMFAIYWEELTARGWALQHAWIAAAKEISWEGKQGPFEPYSKWCEETGCGEGIKDWIGIYALRVCKLFRYAYVLSGLGVLLMLFIAVNSHDLIQDNHSDCPCVEHRLGRGTNLNRIITVHKCWASHSSATTYGTTGGYQQSVHPAN